MPSGDLRNSLAAEVPSVRWVELCAGSASLTLHLLGARRSLLPYQGSKWRFRKALEPLLGLEAPLTEVVLTDPGPWGAVLPVVIEEGARASLIEQLEGMAQRDPREVYEGLHRHPVAHDDAVAFAAEYLFLQRLAFSGKAVGVVDGCWSSPGFNTSSAYGLPGTERFGRVNPMVPSLVRVLRSYELRPVVLGGGQQPAGPPEGPVEVPTVAYLDPPYVGSTRYPNGDLPRDRVVELARGWHRAGARVLISEGEAVPELLAEGWTAHCLTEGRGDTSPFRGKQAEWVTRSP